MHVGHCKADSQLASSLREDCQSRSGLFIGLCHPWYAAMTGLSIPWYYPSIIYEVFCDDSHPLFFVVWSSAAYHDNRHGWTMIACAAWGLTVKAPIIRREYRPDATHIRFVLCAKHPSVAFRLSRTAANVSSYTDRAVLARQVTCRV